MVCRLTPRPDPKGLPTPRPVTPHLISSVDGVSESPRLFLSDSFGEGEGQMMRQAPAGVTGVLSGC